MKLHPHHSKHKYDYIIYHDNCPDGFTSFYLFMKTKLWTPKPTVYPSQPHAKEAPPDIDGKNVIIMDVAYKPDIIKEIAAKANRMLFIDHHVSNRDEIVKLDISDKHEIVYDETHSGASLVWTYFFGSRSSMPQFVKYIEDNDIGAWAIPETLHFMAGLEVDMVMEPSFDNLKKWDNMLKSRFLETMVNNGKAYNKYKSYLIDRFSKHYSIMRFPSDKVLKAKPDMDVGLGTYTVAVINNNCPSVSLLGKKIVDSSDVDFCFLYHYDVERKKYIVSLRSKKADVGFIAKIMGGGGHKFASAFSFYVDEFTIDDLFVPVIKELSNTDES